ncbi:MAG TPA: DUF4097 family beta strand repeat-containing protein [Gemmatimonadales bacterium]|nr:DUF4097 family beta strand repeat-containing protein [Gemmatimonadales bacterium]
MPIPVLFALASLSGGPARPVLIDDFQWKRALASGKTLEIVGINGSIDAVGIPGREAEVLAVKKGRKSDPEEVRIEVVEHPDGVTICAVYPNSRRGEENECREGGKGRNNTRNNDVQVTWTIRVPQGVKFVGRTVNGEIVARRLTAEAEVHTVNGDLTVETTSFANATTVNGSIDARVGTTDWTDDVEFETVNGGITVDLPANASMEVDASTVNGSMSTDFPLTIKGRWGPRRMSGTIGRGGRTLSLSTVNGSMSLRKSP